MRKTIFLAALALLALSAMTGCNKVRKCTKGERGCLDGSPNSDGSCDAGLVVVGGRCVEASGGSSGCNCAIDEVCSTDGESCIGYCEYDDGGPEAKPVPKGCEPPLVDPQPPPYSFADLCVNACEQTCLRAQTYCPGYTCDLTTCKADVTLNKCKAECPGENVACLLTSCFKQQAAQCNGFTCPGTYKTDCTDIRCSDTCSMNNKDGFCDDGDPYSAVYAFCSYGTDCSDCGPRRGSRPPQAALGELCPPRQDVACEGYHDDYLDGSAWCLRVVEDSSYPFRCVPGCTTEDGPGECDDGYRCEAAMIDDDTTFDDAYGTPGYYCQPTVCK
jgi:hypothetical protein